MISLTVLRPINEQDIYDVFEDDQVVTELLKRYSGMRCNILEDTKDIILEKIQENGIIRDSILEATRMAFRQHHFIVDF